MYCNYSDIFLQLEENCIFGENKSWILRNIFFFEKQSSFSNLNNIFWKESLTEMIKISININNISKLFGIAFKLYILFEILLSWSHILFWKYTLANNS